MSPAQEERRQWVNTYLSTAFHMAERLDVRTLRYFVDGSSERVEITFNNGYVKKVDVTGDSDRAVIHDVLKAV